MTKTTERAWRVGMIGLLTLVAAPASAQNADRNRSTDQPDDNKPIIGIQLTPRLLDNLLDKAADRLAKDYHFDEFQREQMRQVLQERIPRFLHQHQAEIQKLTDQWLEAASAEEPPDAEYAARWAEEALPLVEDFKGMVHDMSADMREFLSDDQQILLDGYLAGIDTVTDRVSDRLHLFKEGGFDPKLHWPGNPEARKRNRANARELRATAERARQAAMEKAGGAPATARKTPAAKKAAASKSEKDEWTRYVEAFIKRYQLNDQQQQRARAYLRQQLQQRDRHMRRCAGEIERITKLYDKAANPKELKIAEAAYQRVIRVPINRMFERLKEKLDTLPTRAQRRAATARDREQSRQRKHPPHKLPAR